MKNHIKRTMNVMLAILMLFGAMTVNAFAATSKTEDIVMNYPYPEGFYMPTKFTGTFDYWLVSAGGVNSCMKSAWSDPAEKATYDSMTSGSSKFRQQVAAAGRYVEVPVHAGYTIQTDLTKTNLENGMAYVPNYAGVSNFNTDFARNDTVIKNLIIQNTVGLGHAYTGANSFRNSALETIIFNKQWGTGNYTVDNRYGTYTTTMADVNGRVFGHEASVIIEDYAFADCKNLVTVWFESEPASMYLAPTAFTGCPNLTIHAPYGGVIEAHCKANGIKFESTGVAATTQVEQPTTPVNPQPETPVKPTVSNWAVAQIGEAVTAGLVPDGLGGNYQVEITRAQFAAVSVKLYEILSGQSAPAAGASPFTDTNDPAVIQAEALGFVNGVGDNKFAPNDLVTREQAAVMLSRVYTKLGGSIPAVTATTFADDGLVSGWAKASVAFMAGKGIVNGVGENKFAPQGHATIEQALVIALRMMNTL